MIERRNIAMAARPASGVSWPASFMLERYAWIPQMHLLGHDPVLKVDPATVPVPKPGSGTGFYDRPIDDFPMVLKVARSGLPFEIGAHQESQYEKAMLGFKGVSVHDPDEVEERIRHLLADFGKLFYKDPFKKACVPSGGDVYQWKLLQTMMACCQDNPMFVLSQMLETGEHLEGFMRAQFYVNCIQGAPDDLKMALVGGGFVPADMVRDQPRLAAVYYVRPCVYADAADLNAHKAKYAGLLERGYQVLTQRSVAMDMRFSPKQRGIGRSKMDLRVPVVEKVLDFSDEIGPQEGSFVYIPIILSVFAKEFAWAAKLLPRPPGPYNPVSILGVTGGGDGNGPKYLFGPNRQWAFDWLKGWEAFQELHP